MNTPPIDPTLLGMYEDFRKFMAFAWKMLGLPHPTWIQNSMAHFLQHGPRRRGILGFRGVAKSWITALFVVWLGWRNPNVKIMVVSASKDRADDFTTFVLKLIELLPMCQHLRPRPEEGQRFSRISFDFGPATPDQAPSVKSRGIGSAITGSRADYIIADDIEITNNSLTQVMREKLAHAVKEFDAILKPGGHIVYLGTPQTEQTIYKQVMQRGYTFRIWPIMFPTETQLRFYGDLLAPEIAEVVRNDARMAGQPTDPKRFNRAEIGERLMSYGPVEFARQFMLDTRMSDAEKYPLRLGDLIVTDLNRETAAERYVWASGPTQAVPDVPHVGMDGDRLHRPMDWLDSEGKPARQLPYTGRVLAIDPAGRGKDETSYAVVFMLHSTLFLMKAGGLLGGYSEENLQKLAGIAKDFKVNHVVVEGNFGDGMFTQLLTPYLVKTHPVTVEEVKHSIQKERRMLDVLEPAVHQHRLVVDRQCFLDDMTSTQEYPDGEHNHHYQLWWQFTRCTRERGCLRHDDRLDALSMAVAYFADRLAEDQDAAARKSREVAQDEYLRDFMDRVDRKPGKWTTNGDNWCSEAIPSILMR